MGIEQGNLAVTRKLESMGGGGRITSNDLVCGFYFITHLRTECGAKGRGHRTGVSRVCIANARCRRGVGCSAAPAPAPAATVVRGASGLGVGPDDYY